MGPSILSGFAANLFNSIHDSAEFLAVGWLLESKDTEDNIETVLDSELENIVILSTIVGIKTDGFVTFRLDLLKFRLNGASVLAATRKNLAPSDTSANLAG